MNELSWIFTMEASFHLSYKLHGVIRKFCYLQEKSTSGTLRQTLDLDKKRAIAEEPRDASCQLKSSQLPRNSAETTYTTSPDQIDSTKLEI